MIRNQPGQGQPPQKPGRDHQNSVPAAKRLRYRRETRPGNRPEDRPDPGYKGEGSELTPSCEVKPIRVSHAPDSLLIPAWRREWSPTRPDPGSDREELTSPSCRPSIPGQDGALRSNGESSPPTRDQHRASQGPFAWRSPGQFSPDPDPPSSGSHNGSNTRDRSVQGIRPEDPGPSPVIRICTWGPTPEPPAMPNRSNSFSCDNPELWSPRLGISKALPATTKKRTPARDAYSASPAPV